MKKSFLQLETNIDSCVQIMGKKNMWQKIWTQTHAVEQLAPQKGK